MVIAEKPSIIQVLDRYVLEGDDHAYNNTRHCGHSYKAEVLDPFAASLLNRNTSANICILDVGSGLGEASDYLEDQYGFRLIRSDISMIALGSALGDRIRATAQQLSVQNNSLDGIHMKDALDHIEDKEALLDEFRRILKPGGELIIISDTSLEFIHAQFLYNQAFIKFTKLICSLANYVEEIRNLLQDPSVTNIGPPYFPCDTESFIKYALSCSFECISSKNWLPPKDEQDWYREPMERFVLHFRKKLRY